MSEKVRGAIFSALGDIEDLTVLDAFAGSGALSFEAISRGASSVVAIDNDRNAQRALTDNVKDLRLIDKIKIIKASASAWLTTTKGVYDIVILDPPYDDTHFNLLKELAGRTKPGGIVVLSLPPESGFSLDDGYTLLRTKAYGDATLVFYRRIS